MAGIGRKKKGKMQGSNSYAKRTIRPTPLSTTPSLPPSIKRQRLQYKRRLGHITAIDLSQHFQHEDKSYLGSPATSLRHAIYYHFIHHLDAPHREHWGGKEGTISIIRRALQLPPSARRKIRRTLDKIMLCIVSGEPFDGRLGVSTGRNILISPGSVEEELIATWMESHLGFRMTTMLVNEHRREEGSERVGVTSVINAFYRLKPRINIIEKVQSGGLNEGWMNASYNIAKQMKIMLGEMDMDEIMTDREGTG